mmetsp:Transcript_83936/g.115917  ORF Transcript_83936/g.115917 Transcript_83936/m.115917 type:complete len:208 (-) Transcript_83936:142-765(-)|eukprot:CAMPEP_0176364354 /NCGR_PEP_ID=MMETSP0126-20121128/19735_1 /TAXON_ID=141414 ORGANISM="Strombidinopsis acuminatum, Strain SPMC142" /NCGR_SAMPLE_ID=MMETSP0126 /ASSEMBLY_ACC=CAM_ASM_000229 /LENGTH=207 /DNA_ID=CAMNT_0017720969 /DNA_START=1795 /DNA_END=2418 /DNA_ORIENTATION=-
MVLRINLQVVQAINNLTGATDLEDLAYDFYSQACIIFEEEITEQEHKSRALNLLVSTLFNLTCFGTENFSTLVSNTVAYSSKLLKKNAQCDALTTSAHLFYSPFRKDGNQVMTQLRKALKTSEICMTKPENLYLLVNILNKYVYYFYMEYDFMTAQDINDLISFIKETVDEMEDQEPAKESIIHLENTKLAIKAKQVENERMQQIIL